MQGRMRLMTALTLHMPTHDITCLGRRASDALVRSFRLLVSKAYCRDHHQHVRTPTWLVDDECRAWVTFIGRNLQQRRRGDRKMWRHRPLIPLHTLPLLEQASTPTTLRSSRASLMPFHFLSLMWDRSTMLAVRAQDAAIVCVPWNRAVPNQSPSGSDKIIALVARKNYESFSHYATTTTMEGTWEMNVETNHAADLGSSALGIQKAALSLNST